MDNYKDIIGLNYSGAKVLLKSPAHYQAWLTAEHKDSPAMKFGRLVHTATLQPKEFNAKVAISPDVDRRTKVGKEAYEVFVSALTADTEVVDKDTYDIVCAVTESAEKALASLGCDTTKWSTEEPVSKQWNGAFIKGRPDLVTAINGEKVVIDLKTTQDASADSFSRDVFNFKYFLQAAFYMELTGASRFLLIAVEKEAPYATKVYELDEAAIAEGKRLMESAMSTYVQCLKFNTWPSYGSELTTLSLPRYAFTSSQNQ